MSTSGPSELRLPVRTGRAWAFSDNLAAADILPLRCANEFGAGSVPSLFADIDPSLAARIAPGDVLVAGQNVGHGVGAEVAARALAARGMSAVVASSFAKGFAGALLAVGIPPLEVDAPYIFHTGNRVRMNLEAGTVANLSSGDRQPIRNLTEPMLEQLRQRLGR